MDPVWDFDLAFGGHTNADINNPEGWLAKDIYWNRYLFKDSSFSSYASSYCVSLPKWVADTSRSLAFPTT